MCCSVKRVRLWRSVSEKRIYLLNRVFPWWVYPFLAEVPLVSVLRLLLCITMTCFYDINRLLFLVAWLISDLCFFLHTCALGVVVLLHLMRSVLLCILLSCFCILIILTTLGLYSFHGLKLLSHFRLVHLFCPSRLENHPRWTATCRTKAQSTMKECCKYLTVAGQVNGLYSNETFRFPQQLSLSFLVMWSFGPWSYQFAETSFLPRKEKFSSPPCRIISEFPPFVAHWFSLILLNNRNSSFQCKGTHQTPLHIFSCWIVIL